MPPPRLTDRILHPSSSTYAVEDIFASGLETLFSDVHQSHGVPGQSIIYRSPRFGDVYLRIPTHPDEERGRLLFAHYLWNSGVIAAEGIERGSCDEVEDESEREKGEDEKELVKWDPRFWDMRGLDVLELGAATALPSLISTLSNARTVISTDHPSSPAITSSTIELNFQVNVTKRGAASTPSNHDRSEREFTDSATPRLDHPSVHTDTKTNVYGYTWGTETFYETQGYGRAASDQPKLRSFDRIIVADCLWMPAQHANIVKTVLLYLKEGGVDGEGAEAKRSTPCALVVAGFHTGREVVKDFIEIATGNTTGDGEVADVESGQDGDGDTRGKLRATEICEVDVHGLRRPWQPVRSDESKEQSKRWCVCAILVRR